MSPTLALLSLVALLAPQGPLQDRTPEPVPPSADVLSFYSAGLDAVLTDPRDAGLARALDLVDGRLAELARELVDFDLPPDTLELAFDLLRSPMRIRLAVEDPARDFPVAGELSVEQTSAEQALALTSRVESVLSAALPMPFEADAGNPGLKLVELDGAHVRMGSRPGSRRFEVSVGAPRLGDFDAAPYGLPAGVRPTLALSLDVGALRGPARRFLREEPDGEQALAYFEKLGLFGEQPLRMHAAWGAGHFRVNYEGWARVAESMGSLVREPIPTAHFDLVPADALTATVARMDAEASLANLDLMQEGTVDMVRQMAIAQGFDLDAFVASIGHTAGFYLSEGTGGGGFASAAGFVTLSDSNAALGAIEALTAQVNGIAAAMAEGRLRVRRFEHAGARCFSLTLPGLPVPLEPSFAVMGDVLHFGLMPRALVSALDHVRRGAPGLTASPALRAAGVRSLSGLAGFSMSDTPRFLSDGYGLVSLGMSALANALRSPEDPSREPGILMPSYPELMQGSRPQVVLSRIEGDDLVVTGSTDPSVVATLTAALPGPLTWAIGAMAVGGLFSGFESSMRDDSPREAAIQAERPDDEQGHAEHEEQND